MRDGERLAKSVVAILAIWFLLIVGSGVIWIVAQIWNGILS